MDNEQNSASESALNPKNINTGCILASLLRQIFFDLNINTSRFTTLLDRYTINLKNKNLSIRDVMTIRGNITKEIMKPEITWKVFLKALKFLNVRSFKITLELQHYNGEITVHSKKVNDLQLPQGEVDG